MHRLQSDFETVYLQRRKITMVKAQRHLVDCKDMLLVKLRSTSSDK